MNTPQKAFTLWLTAAALAACGGGERSASPTSVTDTSSSVGAQIRTLETSGRQPKLDRSTDIKGPDMDNNGIRDDIDAWIAAQPFTETQKKATQQAARVMQLELLVRTDDKAELNRLGNASMGAVKCLRLSFMPDYQKGYDLSAQIEAITANTKERTKRYIAYNHAVSGTSGRLPEGNTCEQ